ncbi:hypothetical protein F5884DRAFT_748564 [Xylogone sp. PMI_703]|nr:hypothetical protein F5884DRAFT_748564 [Xylogone sp. PMI_703]
MQSTIRDLGIRGLQPPKLGRPRKNERAAGEQDETAIRRERMRLAQRVYRSRKDASLNSAKERALKLEGALDDILRVFGQVVETISSVPDLPSTIALELSRASLKITRISQKAKESDPTEDKPNNKLVNGDENVDKDGTANDEEISPLEPGAVDRDQAAAIADILTALPKSDVKPLSKPNTMQPTYRDITQQWHTPIYSLIFQHVVDSSQSSNHRTQLPAPPELSFATRYFHACIERGIRLLTSTSLTKHDSVFPALALPLESLSVTQLRASINYVMSSLHGQPFTIVQPRTFPVMYRVIEGNASVVVLREGGAPGEAVQRLMRGKTRTKVDSALCELDGEWLEPQDVQEYLEVQGILLEGISLTSEARLLVPGATIENLRRSEPIEGLEEEEFIDATPAWDPNLSMDPFDLVGTRWQNFSTVGNSDIPQTSSSLHQQTQVDDQAGENLVSISLNLVGLVENLAKRAVCIGPVPGVRREDVDAALRESILKF